MRHILCIILMVSYAYVQASVNPYQLNGTVQGKAISGYAYLFVFPTSLQPSSLILTAIIDNNFKIRGSVKQQEGRYSVARLFFSPKPNIKINEYNSLLQNGKLEFVEFILEPEVNIVLGPETKMVAVRGGALNDAFNQVREISRKAMVRNDSLKRWYGSALVQSRNNNFETKRIRDTYNSLSSEQQNRQTSELLNFITDNPSSVLALDKLEAIASMKEISWRKFLRNFEQVLAVVPEKWLQSPKGRAVVQKINLLKSSQQLVSGAELPDYVFRDGKDSVAVRDFRGKYLLLHFWTSWSETCRAVQNDLSDAFDNYKSKGLCILQISLDANIENWKMALPEDGVAWKQVRCRMGWDIQVERTFEIFGVPTNYLVDQDGKIISSNLWGKELEEKLAELMH